MRIVSVALASLIFVAAGHAFGQTLTPGLYRITAKHSGKCLAVSGGPDAVGNGVPVTQSECSEADNQKWELIAVDSGYYRIVARHSGKSLDVSGISLANFAVVHQWDYVGGANQKWKLVPTADGFFQVVASHSGKSLDVNGGPGATQNGAAVQQWDYIGADNQKWRFEAVAVGLCRQYGERVTGASPSVSGCCTADPVITRLQGGVCEGISPDLPGGSSSRSGFETTIAFVPAWSDASGTHDARLVMGYNSNGGNGFLGWSISTDQGRTWQDRDRKNGGPGGGPVPNPTSTFNSWRGDLSVVALPRPGVVAMVSLADRTQCPPSPNCPDLAVLLVSIDGGETFSKTSVVNDRLGVGIIDQPRVTVDEGDGTVWVMWRARQALTPYTTYLRGGRIGPDGTITWDINGDGQLVSWNSAGATADYQHPRFKVFTRPGATTHTVAVTGPLGAPGITFFSNNRCVPDTSRSFWQYPLGVFFTVSDDNGVHWTDIHSAVDMGAPFAFGCVGGAGGRAATGQVIYSENRIDLARDPRNNTYLVTRARDVSDASNVFIGQQIEVWRRATTPNARFSRVAVAPWSAANPWQFNASIAARNDGQIAVSYYQTSGTTDTVELMVIGSRDGGNTWSAPVQLSRNAPWKAADRSLGEYDEIVALPLGVFPPATPNPGPAFWPGAFYASWSNGVGRVFAAGFTPPPPR